MTLRIAVQLDPLASLNLATDTSLALLEAAAARGHTLFVYQPQQLSWHSQHGVQAHGQSFVWHGLTATPAYSTGPLQPLDLTSMDVILIRQDPPFDLAYITNLHLLERLPARVRVLNHPGAVRNAPEKILITQFAEFMPPTLISADWATLADFVASQHAAGHGAIIKPLYGYGGRQVFHLPVGDNNLASLAELFAAADPSTPLMAQQFLPKVAAGDKRIMLLHGELLAAINRVPATGQVRANLRVGGTAERTTLTARESAMVARLAPTLQQQGLYLVGLDVIDGYLTEINVTSPTGFRAADRLYASENSQSCAARFWAGLKIFGLDA